jgi:plastocyanin
MRRPSTLLAASLLATMGLLTACSDDQSTTTTTSTTVAVGDTSSTTGADCNAKPPGELMTPQEAVIRFSNEAVCPGYVTVLTGTAVTWENTGTEPYTVVVRADPTPDAPVYTEQTIEPGGAWQYDFVEPDQYVWRTDALEAFVGYVEVQGGTVTA